MSTTSLPIRWLVTDFLLFGDNGGNIWWTYYLWSGYFLKSTDELAAFKLPVALAEYFMAVPVENLDIGNVSEEFGGDLVNFPIPDEITKRACLCGESGKNLSGQECPGTSGTLRMSRRLFSWSLFARFLTQMPEFHLS